MDRRRDEWTDGQKNGQMDGRMDGRTDRWTVAFVKSPFYKTSSPAWAAASPPKKKLRKGACFDFLTDLAGIKLVLVVLKPRANVYRLAVKTCFTIERRKKRRKKNKTNFNEKTRLYTRIQQFLWLRWRQNQVYVGPKYR